jgi:sulfate transport system permease protein
MPLAVPARRREATTEPLAMRLVLIAIAVLFLGLFLFLPLVSVFVETLSTGFGP